nr:hypothetical protein [Tanacetum cinerariifolium]
MDQNIDSSGIDQIQTPQYPFIHHPSQEMSEEVFQAKGNLMKSIQTILEKFNCIPFGEMPKILLQAWEKFFAIQHAQPEDTNELFQKLLEDLQIINEELAEYINSLSWNRHIFFNDNEEHSVQYKEYLENSSNEIAASNFNQEKEGLPQDSDIRQVIREECCIEACEEQKQNMEDTLLDALNSKLLSINLRSQRLDKKMQEVKNVVEQPTKHGTRIAESLQNFRVKKSSTYLNNTSQISPVHAITPVLPTEEPEYSLSMGYEHLSTTSKTESDEVIESSVKNLVPIPSEYEVTSEDKSKCDVPVCEYSFTFDIHSEILSDSNNDDISNVILREKLLSINHLISDIESLNDNPTSDCVLKSYALFPIFEESDSSLSNNSLPELEETRSGSTTSHANSSFPEYDSFCFEIEPDQGRLTSVIMKYISDDSTNDPLLEEVGLFLASDNSIPPAVMNNIDEPIEDECFDPGGEINVFANVEDDNYFPFIFVIRIFRSYLVYHEVSPLLLSAASEDTIFDPGISV